MSRKSRNIFEKIFWNLRGVFRDAKQILGEWGATEEGRLLHPLRDPQQEPPRAWCARCRNEIYAGTGPLCPACRDEKERGKAMTLLELSAEYRAHAGALKERIILLRARQAETRDEGERLALEGRIKMLRTMWREARELAALTEHYYERGYRRNGRYTL